MLRLLPLGGLALVCSGFGAGIAVSATAADDPAPVVVTRDPLAEVTAPPGAPHRTLGLSKVVVTPGARLASPSWKPFPPLFELPTKSPRRRWR